MNDSKIIIEVKADGSTTITINSASITVVQANEEPEQQELVEVPTDGQRYYLTNRNKWRDDLTKQEAHALIAQLKQEEAYNDVRGYADAAAALIKKSQLTPGFTIDPLRFEDTPVKKKRGRPRKIV